MVNVKVMQDLEKDGFNTGLYGSPGGLGDEREGILRNLGALRHSLVILVETAGAQTPEKRVIAQRSVIESLLDFYHIRFDEIAETVDDAPGKKQVQYNEGNDSFYFEGADNLD